MSRPFRKNTITAVLIVVVSLFFLGATPQAAFDPLLAIPEGALAVVSSGNPMMLLDNSVRFLRSAGLEQPAQALATALAPLLDQAGGQGDPDDPAAMLLRMVDTRRRLVAAIYPGDDDPTKVSILMMVPVRGGPGMPDETELLDLVAALIPEGDKGGATISLDHPGYLIVGAEGFNVATVESSAHLNLSRLAAYPASSMVLWADVGVGSVYLDTIKDGLGSLFGGFGDDYDDDYDYQEYEDDYDDEEYEDEGEDNASIGNDTALDDTVGDDDAGSDPVGNGPVGNEAPDDAEIGNAGPDGDEYAEDFSWDDEEADGIDPDEGDAASQVTKGLGALADTLENGLGEVKSIEVALTVQADRAWLRFGVQVIEGGKLAVMTKRAAAGDKSLPYLSYCEADALVSFAWSSPADWGIPIMEGLYKLLMPEATLVDTMMASLKGYAAATGNNGAASIGIGVSEEMARAIRSGKGLDDAAALDLVARGLSLSVSGAMELKDRQAFRDTSASMMDIVRLSEYAGLMSASGLALDVKRKVGTVRKMPYDSYSYEFTAADGQDDGTMAAVTALIGNLLSPVYVYKDDKAYLGMGKPESLNALIDRNAAKAPLNADKAFKALRAGAPADTRALFYLSTQELLRLVMRFMPEDQGPLDFNMGKLSGFMSWFDASPGTMGFGMGIGAEDIRAFIELAKK
jgi:hypothetical protein